MRQILFLLMTLLIFAPASKASVWAGLGTDSFVENSANWQGGLLPANNGTASFDFFSAPRKDPTTLTDWYVSGIGFGPGAPSYVLSQSVFGNGGAIIQVGSGGIVNVSSNLQTIEHIILLEQANQMWTSTSAALRVLGGVSLQNRVLTINGAGGVEVGSAGAAGNAFIGPGFVDVASGAKLTVHGAVSADVDVLGGTLIVDTDEPQPIGSVLQFTAGSDLGVIGVHNTQVALDFTGQTTFVGPGEMQVQNGIRGTGSLVIETAGTAGTLGLGGFYLSPFAGSVAIHRGRLELNGAQPGVPMITGPITIGDGVGGSDAELLIGVNGVVPGDWFPVVQPDATLFLGDGVALIEGELIGGALSSSGAYQMELLRARPSGQTAQVDGAWNTPVAGQLDAVELMGGTADPDLRFGASRPGPGGINFFGTGELLLDGAKTTGEGRIRVDGLTCSLSRTGTANSLPQFEANQSSVTALAGQQFGSACELILRNSSFNAGNNLTHKIWRLVLDNASVDNFRSTVWIHEDIDVQTSSSIGTDLFFPTDANKITIPVGQTLTMTGSAVGQDLQVLGGGTLDCRDVSGSVSVFDAHLRSTGTFDNLFVQSVLEIPVDGPDDELAADSLFLQPTTILEMSLRNAAEYSRIQAYGGIGLQGQASIAGTLNLALASGANIVVGDVFELVRTGNLDGLFDSVVYPPLLGADEFWQLWYPSNDQQVLLERRSLSGASLDVTRGTRFMTATAPASLDTTRAVHISVGAVGDLDLSSISVTGVTAPTGGTLELRVYRSLDQSLVGSVDVVLQPSAIPQDITAVLPTSLLQGTDYRIAVSGDASMTLAMRTPVRMPYEHSEAMRVLGADASVGLVAPLVASSEIPGITLNLTGTVTAADPPTTGPIVESLALRAAPNPFNPRTQVTFDLPTSGQIHIDVIDSRGRIVKEVENGFRGAGRHSVTFTGMDDTGRELASGVYFLRLRSGSKTVTRKVVLVR